MLRLARHLQLLILLALLALAAAPPASAAPERFTPVAVSVVAPPQPVEGSDGRTHLAYELLLINRSFNPPAKVTVRGVQALAGGKAVASLAGKSLAGVMFPFGDEEPGVELDKGEAAYVMMDVSLPAGARLPKHLSHRLSVSLRPPSSVVATQYGAAPTRVERREASVVAPPLRGAGWIVGNGCCAELTSHRAGLLPVDGGLHEGERFAIDFIQVAPSGMLATGPLDQLSSFPFFGDPVFSATAGKVVTVLDGLPETPPGALPPSTAARAAGNHVVVRAGPNRFALYAHLQPGSIAVRVGQRVSVGETLGRLGSSGNSNAPHLHFQLMDGPGPLASNGIPYRFDRFAVAGTLANFGGLFEGQAARIEPELRGPHRNQMPLNLQVIDFGG
ncbi:MAG TPA: M23 family metallopeptidase [Solirubrobacterales bacterium]|nr:M23 family metallopeptidase [Solirubrobacterales bacterium]